MAMEMRIVTRSITSNSFTYEMGSQWENYINIAGGDYKIYFFTYNPSDQSDASTNNTLIAEFNPKEIVAEDGNDYTQYTLAGSVGDDIAAYSDFKIVVLANWGSYPSVIVGTTTIDDIVEGSGTTFLAETFFTANGVDADHLIPFYGVHEYSNVKWAKGWRTTLTGDISLLRALAKVEVILNAEDSDIEGFDSVILNRYNSTGYCAPSGVYLKGDYDHGSWEQDFTDAIHLVGNANDTDQDGHTFALYKTTNNDGQEMWVGYLPEYDNTSSSAAELYSYLQVNFDGDSDYEDTRIYFANYADGLASSNADYDIFRNCLYRFYVTVESGEGYFRVYPDKWDDCFDNDYTFGVE